jgi:uncharacterized coiled-coil protein SlyX
VLYAAVAQRLGYPVNLASTKDHLYLRYEEGANHLNVDAAGEGFISHSDDTYRKWPSPLTDEEIKTYGFLQPMSHQEILGAFLTIRASSLTSMKKFDEAAASWEAASHYLTPTPVLNRIVELAKERAADTHNAERWDELWDNVVTQPIPEDAIDYFQNRQAQILLLMNRSTDMAEIEKAAADLNSDVDEYARTMTTDTHKVLFRTSLVPPPMPPQPISEPDELLSDEVLPHSGRILLPAQYVPPEYWHSIPPELLARLEKLDHADEMIEEMQSYAVEEINLRNLESRNAMSQAQFQPPPPLPLGQKSAGSLRPQDLPLPWRGQPVPPELQDRLASLNLQNASQEQIKETINEFFIDQDQQRMAIDAVQSRRRLLDEQLVTHPPFQIEIVPAPPVAPIGSNLPLTIQPQSPINVITGPKEKP